MDNINATTEEITFSEPAASKARRARKSKEGAAPAPAATQTALAPVEPVAADLGALAMRDMKPAEYVATLFQPLNDKLAKYSHEAEVISFSEADHAELHSAQQQLPENERRAVALWDITSKEGMELAKEMRAKLRDEVRLAADKQHKESKAPILTIGRLLDSTKNEIEAKVRPIEERFDAAITAENERKAREKKDAEDREIARVAGIKAKITAITDLSRTLAGATSAELEQALAKLAHVQVSEDEYAEFHGEAALALDATGAALMALYESTKAREEAAEKAAREQEEERQRLAKQAADLAEQQAALDRQREAQEAARLAEEVRQHQQTKAMEAMQNAQEYAAITGTAYQLEGIRAIAATIETSTQKHGMATAMVAMARDMAVNQLQARITALVAEELPQAWDDAHAENARIDSVKWSSSQGTMSATGVLTMPPAEEAGVSTVTVTLSSTPAVGTTVIEAPAWPPAPTDGAEVAALRAAVRTLRATRTMNEIADIVADELQLIELENGHDESQ